jgi:hypothetical protein
MGTVAVLIAGDMLTTMPETAVFGFEPAQSATRRYHKDKTCSHSGCSGKIAALY